MDGLSSEGKILLDMIQSEFAKLATRLNEDLEKNCAKINENCLKVLQEKCVEVDEMKIQMKSLKGQVQKMQDEIDASNQYERKDTLILSGSALPTMSESEDCHEVVRDLLKDCLNINIAPGDINTCHRLGPISRPNGPASVNRSGKRNIIVKFCRRDIKKRIVTASKAQPKTDRKLFCNESLTPLRRSMFHALRRMKADDSTLVKGCTTMEGKVYAFTPPVTPNMRDQRHYIGNMEALREFCLQYVKQPVDRFLEHFTA